MAISNSEISDFFNQYAILLEIQGANPFRIRAYRNAARTIEDLPQSVTSLLAKKMDLTELPGIGKDLAQKIEKMVKTGKFQPLEKLEKKFPAGLIDLVKIPGLGPKRIKIIYDKFKINTLDDLKKICIEKKLSELIGFSEKIQSNILKEIERLSQSSERKKLFVAEQVAEPLVDFLEKVKDIKKVVIAGSYRRRKETVGDLDILITAKANSDVINQIIKYKDIQDVISKGKTRSTFILKSGMQVDIRVVPQVSYGAALHYFTGSKSHNIAIRKLAIKKGLKINEYGVFKKNKRISGKTENEIYKLFNLKYIEPELRENAGEIEAARKHKLPKLISLKDIRGDLHVHTKQTDGKNTLEEIVKAAKEHGYSYLAITDHTKHLTVAHGLNKKDLEKQIEKIDRINEKNSDFTLLKSAEVDILEDGSLDLPDSILKKLDLTVCSVHYKFKLSEKKQTERIIRAMQNPYFKILAHPTGRLIGKREAYAVDLEKIIKAAAKNNVFLEINSQPERMDLDDIHIKLAKEFNVLLSISTDAHSVNSLNYMRFGVDQARRGWLEKKDVLNTRTLSQLKKLLHRK